MSLHPILLDCAFPNNRDRCNGLIINRQWEVPCSGFSGLPIKVATTFPSSNQKTENLALVLVDKVIPFCGVPKALLPDCGTNLLSHLKTDIIYVVSLTMQPAILNVTAQNSTTFHSNTQDNPEGAC